MANAIEPAAEADLNVAVEAARRGAAFALSGWGRSLTVEHKGPLELVTQYDRGAEEAAKAWIEEHFPDDAMVLEESGGLKAGRSRVWYVDPLDGTTNFAHGLPLFCTSVGLVVDGQLAAGAVVAPVLKWEFAALKGGGATFNGRPIRVSETADMNEALAITGMPYHRRDHAAALAHGVEVFIRNAQGVRRLGAAALDLCFVACGWLDAFYELGLKPWDLAAGMLIVQEAGGRVTDWKGEPAEKVLHSGQVAASNALLHARLLELLDEVASQF